VVDGFLTLCVAVFGTVDRWSRCKSAVGGG
jgi:hypothetical protein